MGGAAAVAGNAGFGVGAGGEMAGASGAAAAGIGATIGSALLSGGTSLGVSFAAAALLGKFAKKAHEQRPQMFLDVAQSSVASASPRIVAIGHRIRTPCYLLYASVPVRNQQSGGKGGSQAKANLRPVFQDVAYAINDRLTSRLLRLHINGRVTYFTERNFHTMETHRWAATSLGSAINITMTSRLDGDLSKMFVPLVKGGGTAASGTTTSLTVAGTPWTNNQWVNYTVYIVSGTGAGSFGVITSNTDHVLTISAGFPFAVAPGAGSGFQFEGVGDVLKLSPEWGANAGYWTVYSVTAPTATAPSVMELVPRDGQTPTNAAGGTALQPAKIERADGAIVSSFMSVLVVSGNVIIITLPGGLAGNDPYLKFRVGDSVVLRNFRHSGSAALNGGTFKVTRIAQRGTWFEVQLDTQGAWSVGSAPFDAGTYNTAGRIQWDTQSTFLFGSMSAAQFYQGDETQTQDSVLVSHLGATEVPGFRGMAYLRMTALNRTDYGNAPQTAEAVQEPDAQYCDVGAALQQIHVLAGQSADTCDGSLCSDLTFYGAYRRGPQPAVQLISAISMFWQIANQDRGGQIVYFPVASCPQVALTNGSDYSELGVSTNGKSAPKVLKTATSFRDLPTSVTVKYQNTFRELVDDSATFALRHPSGDATISADVPDFSFMSAPPNIAADAATSILRRAVVNGNRRTLSLGARRLNVLENDALTFTDDDGDQQVVRVVDGTLSLDTWMMPVTGMEEDLALQVGGSNIDTLTGNGPSSTTQPPQTLNFQVLDIPPVTDAIAFTPGLVVTACCKLGGQWPGATVHLSLDGGSNYRQVASLDAEVAIGVATTTLADHAASEIGAVVTKDTTSSVTVQLDALGVSGGLSSASTASVLAGQNWALLGNEILAFETATQVDATTWTLTNLYRGLRASDPTGHTSSDAFVLLTNVLRDGGKFISVPVAAGTAIKLKLVPSGATLASVTATDVTFQGWNVRPLPIYDGGIVPLIHVGGTNDVYFAFQSRTRLNVAVGSQPPFAFDESFEEFSIRFFTSNTYATQITTGSIGGNGLVFSTKDQTSGKTYATRLPDSSWWYTAADQTTDGFTPGVSAFYFDVRQNGDFGWSRPVRYSA